MTKAKTKATYAKQPTWQPEPDKLADAKRQGQAQFDSIKEMVEALEGHEAAAIAEGWTGPHKDKFGAQYFEQISDGARVTWCCATWKELCEEFSIEPGDDAREAAEQTIHEDALSVRVRSGWYSPGASKEDQAPAEYEILLCTGGPACRIVGDLSEHGEPETARLEVQDWFQPWTEMRPIAGTTGCKGSKRDPLRPQYDSEPTLLAYARCFYFGEG